MYTEAWAARGKMIRSKRQEVRNLIQSFKDLTVYRRSYEAAISVYRMTSVLPREELYGLTSQLKRAATSIPLNIAEGYGKRENANEFKRFLLMAIGSCDEMKVLVDMCKDLGFIEERVHGKYEQEYDEIGKMLMVLRARWK